MNSFDKLRQEIKDSFTWHDKLYYGWLSLLTWIHFQFWTIKRHLSRLFHRKLVIRLGVDDRLWLLHLDPEKEMIVVEDNGMVVTKLIEEDEE